MTRVAMICVLQLNTAKCNNRTRPFTLMLLIIKINTNNFVVTV